MPAPEANPQPPPKLKGRFVECCDCFTICPCWITQKADEGHCTGLYGWAFDDDAQIAGESLMGKAIAAASYHGKRQVTQTVLFLDRRLSDAQHEALLDVFAGDAGPRFNGLRDLLGEVIVRLKAQVSADLPDPKKPKNWSIRIESGEQVLADAKGVDRVIVNGTKVGPVAVSKTALDAKMGVTDAVRVQDMDRLELAISALPGGSFVYVGRAGMAGQFDYSK